MNLKYKKYDNYKPSGVEWLGDVPEHWERTRLGTRFIERREKVSDKDFEPLSVTKNGIVPQLATAAKSNDGDNRKLVKSGDFVINSRSDRKGSSGISTLDGSVSLINIVLEPQNIHPIYCHHLLKSNGFKEEFYRNGHGIVADLWTTRFYDMKSIIVAIPTLTEQTAIANFLDRKTTQIDKAIAQKEQLIELLKERRQILIHEELSKAEKESEVIRLKYILNSKLKYGANESGVEYSKSLPRYVRITDFGKDGKLNDKTKLSLTWEIGKEYLLDDGDILFARSGATVGKTYQFKKSMSKEKYYSYAGYLIKAEPNSDFILSDYLYLFTNSDFFNSWKESIFNKATIENIGADKYSQLPVILPSITKQKEILSTINNQSQKIKTAISLKQQEIAALKEYKTVLIDAAVTGKIVVD
jgi:type I restriction enzyme S subunit